MVHICSCKYSKIYIFLNETKIIFKRTSYTYLYFIYLYTYGKHRPKLIKKYLISNMFLTLKIHFYNRIVDICLNLRTFNVYV